MIENRPVVTFVSHCMLIAGIAIIAFPIWITFVASTHDAVRMTQIPLPLLPGGHFFANLDQALNFGIDGGANQGVGMMLFNSLIMALSVAIGKISISILTMSLRPLCPVSNLALLIDSQPPRSSSVDRAISIRLPRR